MIYTELTSQNIPETGALPRTIKDPLIGIKIVYAVSALKAFQLYRAPGRPTGQSCEALMLHL